MKHLIGTAFNIQHVVSENNIYTGIEAVLVVGEKTTIGLTSSGLRRDEVVSDIRFSMDIDDAKKLIKSIAEWIQQAESLHERLTLKGETK